MSEINLQEQLTQANAKIAKYTQEGNDIMKCHYQSKRAGIQREIERLEKTSTHVQLNLLGEWTIKGQKVSLYGYGNAMFSVYLDDLHFKTGSDREWCYMQILQYLTDV